MKVTAGTIARTIILALALLNSILTSFGYDVIKIPDETINAVVDGVFLIVAAVLAWWRNNSFTPTALEADEHLKALKKYNKAVDEQ